LVVYLRSELSELRGLEPLEDSKIVKFTNGRLSFSLFSFLFSFFFSIYFLLFLFLEHKVRVSDVHESRDAWKDIEGSRAK